MTFSLIDIAKDSVRTTSLDDLRQFGVQAIYDAFTNSISSILQVDDELAEFLMEFTAEQYDHGAFAFHVIDGHKSAKAPFSFPAAVKYIKDRKMEAAKMVCNLPPDYAAFVDNIVGEAVSTRPDDEFFKVNKDVLSPVLKKAFQTYSEKKLSGISRFAETLYLDNQGTWNSSIALFTATVRDPAPQHLPPTNQGPSQSDPPSSGNNPSGGTANNGPHNVSDTSDTTNQNSNSEGTVRQDDQDPNQSIPAGSRSYSDVASSFRPPNTENSERPDPSSKFPNPSESRDTSATELAHDSNVNTGPPFVSDQSGIDASSSTNDTIAGHPAPEPLKTSGRFSNLRKNVRTGIKSPFKGLAASLRKLAKRRDDTVDHGLTDITGGLGWSRNETNPGTSILDFGSDPPADNPMPRWASNAGMYQEVYDFLMRSKNGPDLLEEFRNLPNNRKAETA